MRPSGGCQQCHPPGTLRHYPGCGGTQIEQSSWSGRGRVELGFRRRIFKYRQAAVLRDHTTAVTIDRERHDPMGEALTFVVEVENRIRERMAERMMERLI